MTEYENYLQQCIQLASKGLGNVAPNPMVGCVLVYNNKIIGEGFHKQFGDAHAEVEAINSVTDKNLLRSSTLFVNLEPCSHFGKTPPCADLIIENKIPKVVIGCYDSNNLVSGKGIEKLRNAGVDVITGVLEEECRKLNKRFFTYHEKKRPFVILKWAQTKDGMIDLVRVAGSTQQPLKITNTKSNKISHQWKSEEQAIIVGTNTALLDNPQLTVREVIGKNPLRLVIDKELRIPKNYHLFDNTTPTLVFTMNGKIKEHNIEFVIIDFQKNIIPQILDELFRRNIQSLIVEGGTQLINSFVEINLWDEARVFESEIIAGNGVKAPVLKIQSMSKTNTTADWLTMYENNL